MRSRQFAAALAGLLLAGFVMLLLPRYGDTGGWRESFSPALPAPAGPHPVGVRRMRLIDNDRADPWRPAERRTVMVDVHYPARGPAPALADHALAQYMTEMGGLAWAPGEERRLGLRPREVNWLFRTRSREWVPPAPGRLPVLIGSPPPGVPRTAYTGAAEELASHGYAVVTVDHPFDSPVVEFFPTRRVVRPADATTGVHRAGADATRVADLAFVIRRLSNLDRELAGRLDPGRLGLFGWAGAGAATRGRLAALPGVAAIAAFPAGTRPGASPAGAGDAGTAGVPLLLLGGSPVPVPAGGAPGWRAVVSVPGATARAFTDEGTVLAQVAARYPRVGEAVRRDTGTAQPLAYRTARQVLVRFFDMHLRGRHAGPLVAEPGVHVEVVAP